MATQEVAIKPNLNITLKPDTETLEEVVVVAYGTAKKSSFTGSAATIKADKITKQQNSNVSKALEGAVSGVQITSSTGQPGSEASIFVRGIGSISASKKPLIVVDGVPYEGSLNSINNADIESMTILKDAAANSLYGARGANGVVMITTKKGINGKTTVSLDAKWGINSRGVKAYKTIRDAGQYYEMFWEALKNANISTGMGQAAAAWDASQNLVASLGGYNVYDVANNQLIDPTTGRLNPNAHQLYSEDWQEDPFKNGLRQEYNISVNGGNERSSFYASLGYLNDEGIIVNSDYERISGRIRADYQAKKWLKLGANVGYIHSVQHSVPNQSTAANSANLMYFTSSIAPIYPAYVRVVDANGNVVIKQDDRGHNAYDFGLSLIHISEPTRP